MMIYWMYN